MAEAITALIFRYDPDRDHQPRFQEYRVNAAEETSVLVLLNRIQTEIDPSLAFRSFCCGLQMCGSCLMTIDQKKRFACLTLVKPGETVTVEPLTYPDGHVRDLVCRMTHEEQT